MFEYELKTFIVRIDCKYIYVHDAVDIQLRLEKMTQNIAFAFIVTNLLVYVFL